MELTEAVYLRTAKFKEVASEDRSNLTKKLKTENQNIRFKMGKIPKAKYFSTSKLKTPFKLKVSLRKS